MSNREIYTTPVRCSFPHLGTPKGNPQKPDEPPKYMISLMAPYNGQCTLTNPPTPSSLDNIKQALNEVCMEEWSISYEQAIMPGMGINFPPNFKNGNAIFEKDAAGNPIPNQISPFTKDMEILSVKNAEPVGVVDHTGNVEINPNSIYGGCWVSCCLEVSAYTNTSQQRVLVVKLLHVQMAYDDTPFGGKGVTKSATQTFAGRAIANSNVQAGFGQTAGQMPAVNQNNIPVNTGAAPPPAIAPANVPAVIQIPPPPPAIAPANVPAVTQIPPPPPPPAITPVESIIMNAGEAPYATYIAAGWTDEMIIQNGKGQPNMLNVQA